MDAEGDTIMMRPGPSCVVCVAMRADTQGTSIVTRFRLPSVMEIITPRIGTSIVTAAAVSTVGDTGITSPTTAAAYRTSIASTSNVSTTTCSYLFQVTTHTLFQSSFTFHTIRRTVRRRNHGRLQIHRQFYDVLSFVIWLLYTIRS